MQNNDLNSNDSNHDQELRDKLVEMSKPIWITDAFVNRPGTTFGFGVLVVLALAASSVALGYYAIKDIHERDYLIWDNEAVEKYDLWKLAKIYI